MARRYADGRTLRDDVLARWGSAVSQFTPPDARTRVLDLGAGTGIFARAWPRWRPCEVVALEPSAAMRSEMVRGGLPEGVHVLGGLGERLPLRRASIDVAWLSTVVHHLVDLDQCARELRRVLAGDGVVLIRGLFADGCLPAGLRLVPGWERAVAEFPSPVTVAAILRSHGLWSLGRVEVEEIGPSTIGAAADWIRRLRHADSLLGRFTDDELDEGLAAMDRCDPNRPLDPSPLTLLAFGVRRQSGEGS